MANQKVAANTVGIRERHTASAPAEHGKPNWWIIGLIGALVFIVIGAAVLTAQSGTPAPLPTVEQPTPTVEPLPTNRNTRNHNTNDADHGSVNINGDGNRVNVDNRQSNATTIIHHHHHTTVVEPPKPVEPVVRTVLVRTTELRTDSVSPDCNRLMAEHHRRVAGWYDELAGE